MSEFLHLKPKDQKQILDAYQESSSRFSAVTEKDIWVCWVLKHLFSMPEGIKKNMAFKGGTSLSKVYGVIDRFSEDVDITLDYRQFEVVKELNLQEGQTVPEERIGSGTRRRLDRALKHEVKSYITDIVAPYLRKCLEDIPSGKDCLVEVLEGGESLTLDFPSVLGKSKGQYMRDTVLIEFGGRNIIKPNESHTIKPYLADEFPDFRFPIAENVIVLSAERTFWEKATLIHVACHKPILASSAARLSRHWFDLASMSIHALGGGAVANIELMQDVVSLKQVFFNSTVANYDKCLSGGFCLVPDIESLQHLTRDYNEMQTANMLYGEKIAFESIMHDLKILEDKINILIKESLNANQ